MNIKKVRHKLLAPFAVDVDPNKVTALSLTMGIGSGVLFAFNHILLGAVILSLSGFLDLLDGEIAKTRGKTSKKGDIFDHLGDRIVDASIFGGIAFSSYAAVEYGLVTAIMVLMISYLGTQSQAVLGKRLYKGIMGRFPRTVSLIALCLAAVLIDQRFLYYGIIVMLGFATLTVLQRIWEIHKRI